MSRLLLSNRIPYTYDIQTWTSILREVETQVNLLSETKIAATHNATTDSPTTGDHNIGDFVKNSSPTVLGTTPNRYVVYGWICTAAGTPGTWYECRFTVGDAVVAPSFGSITFTGAAPTVS